MRLDTLARWAVLAVTAACGSSAPTVPDGVVPDAVPDANAGAVARCYSAVSEAHPAVTGWQVTFSTRDRMGRDAAITALEAAVTELPDEEQPRLLLGLANLWRLAEPLPGEEAPEVQLPSALAAREHLEAAYQRCPSDHRIAAWLGPVLVRFGRVLGDQAVIDEGLAVLDAGIAAYPSFVLFSKLLVYADLPRDDPEFVRALDAVVENADACAATPADPACTDHALAPHNREGAALFLGDVLAKAGRRDDALAAYEAALEEPAFATWPYQDELEERVAGIDVRVALHANDDPDDDPPVAWAQSNQCAVCHQAVPAP